ncbi:hypothetical protein BHM03_00028355 [Ensete ventricosum]|nr:hypothetical protein BHM03_00028355 [Ensete ventricosum]
MFNLEKIKSGSGACSGLVAPSSTAVVVIIPTAGKRLGTDVSASLMKRRKRVGLEELVDTSESTTEVPTGGGRESVGKGKEPTEVEEVPERGYSIQDLCEVEDRAGLDRYFASIMTLLKTDEGEDPLTPRWSSISRSTCALIDRVHDVGQLVRHQHERILALQVANKELKVGANQELVAAIERHAKELEEIVEKLWAKLESLRSQRKDLEQEVSILHSSLDGARDDRALLEGDVLSLTKAMTLLEAELKTEGLKVVVAYKASQGFESGREKMGVDQL